MECPSCKRYEWMRYAFYPQPGTAEGRLGAHLCQNCGYDSSKNLKSKDGEDISYTAYRRGPEKWQWPPTYEPEQDMIWRQVSPRERVLEWAYKELEA